MMKYFLSALVLLTGMIAGTVPARAQDDGWAIAGQILGAVDQAIRESQYPGEVRSAPYYGDPGSSGATNLSPGQWNSWDNGWTPTQPNSQMVYPSQPWQQNQVVYPNNVYRPQTVYPSNSYPSNSYPSNSYPSNSYPSNTGGYTLERYPSSSNLASPPLEPAVSYSYQPIVIRCPSDQEGIASYVLSNGKGQYNYTMTPGQKQSFKEDASWTIKFDRGNGGGLQEYRLRGGKSYKFVRDASGYWTLFMEKSA